MPRATHPRWTLIAGLGLAALFALGFAVDTIVLVAARAGTEAPAGLVEAARGPQAPVPTVEKTTQSRSNRRGIEDAHRQSRPVFLQRLARTARPGGTDRWYLGMAGITLALAVSGGIVAAARRFLPSSAAGGMEVISRVSLSPKHTVYLLRLGRRVLVVGTGPQGAPSLISELDDLPEIEPDPRQGDEP